MTAQKSARLLDVCLALDRKPNMRREGETRDWHFPGNWIRRLSRTGGWQATCLLLVVASSGHASSVQ
jgi:hypothetical protein